MNLEQFKKNLHRQFRIQPAMQVYEANGILRGSLDDAWILTAITENTFTLRNRATDHFLELGFDSYMNFVEDPGGKVQHQTDGILVLKAQLYMQEGVLRFAPTIAPGKELRDFTPPGTRKSLLDAVRSRLNEEELQRLREDFDARGFPEVRRALDEISGVITSLVAELQAQGLDVRVDVHPYRGGHLLWTCGWWVTIAWQQRGRLRDSYLSLVKHRGRPNVAGLAYSFDQAEPVSQWKYHYGLARPNEVGWQAPDRLDVALSTRNILERLLIELFRAANKDPAPFWDDDGSR